MGLNAHGDRPAIIGEINITPLTDIFLVLLIIMMVVAPMIDQTRADITLPDLTSGQPVEQGQLAVEVTSNGEMFLKGEPVSETALSEQLKTRLPQMSEKNLIIRADKKTTSGHVLKVLEAARDAGFEKVTVSGEMLSEQRSAELQSNQPQP